MTLLKLDIDFNEGALLRVAGQMIESGEARVESILVELGDFSGSMAACDVPDKDVQRRAVRCERKRYGGLRLRGGNWTDVVRMQRLGFATYRINEHINRELFDWRGYNLNTKTSAQPVGWVPLFGLRGIRRLDFIPPGNVSVESPLLWGQSLLFSKQRLAEPVTHNQIDLRAVSIGDQEALNVGNPAWKA